MPCEGNNYISGFAGKKQKQRRLTEHTAEILKIFMNQVFFVCVMDWHSPQYLCLVCLFVFAGDSGQGFRDKYIQQLAVSLEIISV